MPFTHAALVGCAVTTGVGAVTRHAMVEPGATMLVIGCGGVGLNVVQGGRLAGAGRIIACDVLDNKLDMARHFGATGVINSSRENVPERVREIVGGPGVDYAFDTVAIDKTLAVAIDAIAPGGRTVTVGVPAVTMQASFSPFALVLQEKTISGTFYGSSRPSIDFPRLVDHCMAERLNIGDLISRTYSLDQINEGFDAMMSGEVARGVIVFN
jgi:S-(hydroxymethyl)glutathione dehydrogenase/alcohol dehydrogenase